MKIDLNNASTALFSTDLTKKGAVTRSSAANGETTEDRASLSSQGSAVLGLVTKALDTPPIREEKVSALRDAVNNGSYSFDPAKTANAIFDTES